MRKILLFLTLIITTSVLAQQSPIVTVDWLSSRLDDEGLVIIHVGNQEEYDEGHIPGALFVFHETYVFTSGMAPEDSVYDMPETQVLQQMVESLGITQDSKLVLYPGRVSHLSVTRLLFTFHYLGFDQVSILSGGKGAWEAKGLELTTEKPDVSPTKLNLKLRKDLIVSKKQVGEALNSDVKIVDCRAEVFYNGIDVNQMHGGRKGRIKGAVNIPFTSLFEKSDQGYYKFVSTRTLENIFEMQGLKQTDDIILYCHIGLQLTSVYTSAKQLGYTNVRVFDGSFHEYGPDSSLPVDVE